MTSVRFFSRRNELFPNSRANSFEYASAAFQAIKGNSLEKVIHLENYPNIPLVKLDERNFIAIYMNKPLGAGGVGQVYRCRHLVLDENQLQLMPVNSQSPFGAVKISQKPHDENTEGSLDTEKLKDYYQNEGQILYRIGYSAFNEPLVRQIDQHEKQIIPMRFINGECLEDHIKKIGKLLKEDKLTEEEKQILIQQEKIKMLCVFDGILQQLQYLHTQGIAHFDVQASNIILETIIPPSDKDKKDATRDIKLRPWLVDYQVSKEFKEDGYATLYTFASKEASKETYRDLKEDFEDTDALKRVHSDKTRIFLHKNIDIYNMAQSINFWLFSLEMEKRDPIFTQKIEKITELIRSTDPQKREIEEYRRQLSTIAAEMNIKLEMRNFTSSSQLTNPHLRLGAR